jgi:hypothetical protein
MKFQILAKVAAAVALTVGLAGCMDVTMDVEVQNETNGKLTTTMVMGADFYAMAKSGMAAGGTEGAAADDGFCKEAGDVLVENADGSATCTTIVEGPFDTLRSGDAGATAETSDDGATFEVVSPGVVKVSFSTKDMSGELGTEGQDEQTKAMMLALFEGHNITLRVHGKEVIDTNMTKSADGTSAEIVIPFLDLLNGTAKLPETLFATVKTN